MLGLGGVTPGWSPGHSMMVQHGHGVRFAVGGGAAIVHIVSGECVAAPTWTHMDTCQRAEQSEGEAPCTGSR